MEFEPLTHYQNCDTVNEEGNTDNEIENHHY